MTVTGQVPHKEAPLRQRLRSANDASTYAWICISRAGTRCSVRTARTGWTRETFGSNSMVWAGTQPRTCLPCLCMQGSTL